MAETTASQPPQVVDATPRVIDENTDMTTLTDQEIMKLMDGMNHQEDVMSKVYTPFRLISSTLHHLLR